MNIKATNENNNIAYKKLLDQAKKSAEAGKNIIIDCGMIEEKLKALEMFAENNTIKLHKYFLEAPYDILMQRVKERDLNE